MIIYCDTSILAKRYIEEKGSHEVKKLLEQATEIVTSALSELELCSFTERCKKTSRIPSPACRRMVAAIDKDFKEEAFNIVEISREIFLLAKQIIRRRYLRPPDAIQLATASDFNRRLHGQMLFCCADQTLLHVAPLEGLRCWNIGKK